ncbi:serine protease [Streptomyces sp. NPDC059979]|uniref:serine protease n=1 Tax=Streptomyces sp. NPDC059979 TaxID=3347021 RepID=UPI00368446FC
MAELVKICDPAGRARGSGFVADDRGTVVTSHEAVDGLTRVVLHGPGPAGRTWLAEAADVTALPGLALALVRTDGLGVRPLPVALREVIDPGTYVRLPARGWRQARVLGGAAVTYAAADSVHAVPAGLAVELAIGTDGRDALLLGGEACGGPVLDATTGAVLAVLGTALRAEHRAGGFAVTLRAAAATDPYGPLATLLERNAATVPGHGSDLNLAGALELTATTVGAAFPAAFPTLAPETGPAPAPAPAPETGPTPSLGAGPDPGPGPGPGPGFDPGPGPGPGLGFGPGPGPGGAGSEPAFGPGSGRAFGPGAGEGAGQDSEPGCGPGFGPGHGPGIGPVSEAGFGGAFEGVERPGTAAELEAFIAGDRPVLGLVGDPGTGRTTVLAALAVRRARGDRPAPTLWLRGADLCAGDTSLADALTRALETAARIVAAADTLQPRRRPGPGDPGAAPPAAAPHPTKPPAPATETGDADGPRSPGTHAPRPAGTAERGHGTAAADHGIAEHLAQVVARAGRPLLVVLDAPEEMPPELAHRLAPWTEATAGWLLGTAARLVVAARPEYWERAGALYPPEALHTPDRPARRLPPALPLADLTPAEAETVRARLTIPDGAVREADARHPLTLRLLAGIRAAGVTAGRPGRDEVFAAHLDLLCLRAAVRIAAACADAGGSRVHGPGVRRLAARVAGRVHEAARRCLGPGQGQLDRDSFEELFPWRTGWASAVLTEGLLVPAGPGYRFGHEELSDWIQAGHLDVPTALGSLVHGPAGPGLPVPRHRIGPVLEALRRLSPDRLRSELTALVHRLNHCAEEPEQAGADRVWWAARLLRETLLRAPDASPHLPVLHALAEHVARAGPGEFGGWFWNRLRLPEPDRLDLLRRLLPADPAEAVPGDRFLDAAARRLVRDPQRAQPLLCSWFTDGRRLRGRPGATVATAAQALLHTHRRLAVDDLTEALVNAAHPRADELLAVLAEEEPSALCRAVDRWSHDERPGRRVAAAAYGLATAPHVRTPADRELLRYAAQALLARPADATLHGSALGMLLRDPQVRGRYLPDALACFRDPERGSRLPAAALVAALPVLPDPDAVFAALRARADGEVVRALAALTTPGLARRAGDLVREHLARCPEDAAHAAVFVDRRLEQGPAAAPVLRPLVLDLLRGAPAGVRAELAGVLAAPGGEPSYPLRGELADVLLREETDPRVLDAFLGALAAGTASRPEGRARELLRRTGRQLLGAPGGPAVFEKRTVELARSEPAFGALVARWLAAAGVEAAALLGPSARRTVETLSRAAPDVT